MTKGVFEGQVGSPRPTISYGQGIYLFDADGRRYIDACSGAISANLGHGLEEIARAGYEQAIRVAFTYRSQFRNAPAEDLAQTLISLAPKGFGRVLFVNSGSEATEAALRMALQYWQARGLGSKSRFLSRKVSYHGMTFGALGVSGHFYRRYGYQDILWSSPQVEASYCYRCPFGQAPEHCHLECAQDLERAILAEGPENIAAFVAEPIVGAAGAALVPKPQYFSRIREICDRYDVLLIIDEVLTGLGRTGNWYAISDFSVSPDLLLVGKGLGAGYSPMGAVLISEKIAENLETSSNGSRIFGHTYGGNPQSAAIAMAVLQFIVTHGLIAQIRRLGSLFGSLLRDMAERHPIIGDVRGIGLLWGIELVADRDTRTPFDGSLRMADRLTDTAFATGLLVYPSRGQLSHLFGDAVLLAPPFIATEQNLYEIVNQLDFSFSQLERDMEAGSRRIF